MGVRKTIADALGKELNARRYKIVPTARNLDQLEAKRPAVMIVRRQITDAPTNPMGDYEETLDLWVIEPSEASEDRLDDALDDVLEAVERIPFLRFTTAERSVFGDQEYPAWRLEVTTYTNKE